MGDPSAILAINSLDRYITTQSQTQYSFLEATWTNGATFVTATQPPPQGGSVPIVGALLTNTAGIPPNTFITSIGPATNQVNISNPTTIAQPVPTDIIQEYSTPAGSSQPISNALYGLFNDVSPYSHNFTIQSPGALIYGYINRIIVSQIQLQYNIPTVNLDLNDTFYIFNVTNGEYYEYIVPHGFYYADELAAVLQQKIRITTSTTGAGPITDMAVSFVPRDGFVFNSPGSAFYFVSPQELKLVLAGISDAIVTNVYKTLRLLGMGAPNAQPTAGPPTTQTSFDYPNFLYTPYIDIYSDVLTNYQNIKDTNTSVQKPKGLVARIYVSGTGQIQITGSTSALGTAPFVMTSDLNSPKVIRWSPDVAVPSIDFQLLDQYGDFIPGAAQGFSTEFQLTLLCVEGRD